MKISVIGTGYVGLVSGTGFAEMGNEVFCVDVDQQKIENLKNGILPIYEPGLEELVERNYKAERLHFTTNTDESVKNAEVIFIAVGTPSDVDGRADLKYVLQVAEDIGKSMNDYKVIVTKSTVPVGTAGKVAEKIQQALSDRGESIDFDVVSNPEFLKEGAAVEDFLRPDRIVVGCSSERSKNIMQRLYAPFVRNGHPVYFMDVASSEMTKYAANAMLATKISFINELSRLCEEVGADISNVRSGIGSDSRIGFSFIYAGLGYGGSCFPKDVKAIVKTGIENHQEMAILTAVEKVNQEQRRWFTQKIIDHYAGDLKGKTFAFWGLAFKPGTDDMREAPSIYLAQKLSDLGAKIKAYDPVAVSTAKKEIQAPIEYIDDPYLCLEDADAMVLVTEWREFREPDFKKIKSQLKEPMIFDGRNQYDPKRMKDLGFSYKCIGRV
ncbi:MAG: UDP-glucose/GDP-mannose dehydrogenase family protein [Bdellovibrionales bacterium]|nr:UDP-glucose/GDP-mannose dehydrogenase family protein [Bdellovibrionales bacterium]